MWAKKYLTVVLVMLSFVIMAQHEDHTMCGVSIEDQQMMEKLYPTDARGFFNREDILYIPIKFHLTADSDGQGRLNDYFVLNQLCRLNTEFDSSGIQFYIYNGFNYLNNTNIYSAPANNNTQIVLKKDSKALNVFITENADTGSTGNGTTLGYYSPQGDYVIVRKAEFVKNSNTLSHEIGHFLSLRHTFYGWENKPYDKTLYGDTILFEKAPGNTTINIEVMNGSNCDNSADNTCDTPPDYNFGLTASSCLFNQAVYDINRERVRPMINNQMGYFNDCNEYYFTDGQTLRMRNNFMSSGRAHLRHNYTPNTTYIEDAPVVTTPTQNQLISTYDRVFIDWDDVQGASMYLVEVRRSGGYYYSQVVTSSEITLTNLEKSFTYNAIIRPFNEVNTCTTSKTIVFKTGTSNFVGVNDVTQNTNLELFPNPVIRGNNVNIHLSQEVQKVTDITVCNSMGQIIQNHKNPYEFGNGIFNISTSQMHQGMYYIKLQAGATTLTSKLMVQ